MGRDHLEIGTPGTYGNSPAAAAAGKPKSKKGCCNWKCCIITTLLLVLFALEAILIFFLIPREPCISFKSFTTSGVTYTVTPPTFSVLTTAALAVANPSYVSVGVHDLALDVYHACCTEKITTVSDLGALDVPARSTGVLNMSMPLSSSGFPNFSQCAGELAITGRCKLKFVGNVQPTYMSYKLPSFPIEFEQYITR